MRLLGELMERLWHNKKQSSFRVIGHDSNTRIMRRSSLVRVFRYLNLGPTSQAAANGICTFDCKALSTGVCYQIELRLSHLLAPDVHVSSQTRWDYTGRRRWELSQIRSITSSTFVSSNFWPSAFSWFRDEYTSSPIETDDTRGIEAPLVRTLVLLTVYPEFIFKASILFSQMTKWFLIHVEHMKKLRIIRQKYDSFFQCHSISFLHLVPWMLFSCLNDWSISLGWIGQCFTQQNVTRTSCQGKLSS